MSLVSKRLCTSTSALRCDEFTHAASLHFSRLMTTACLLAWCIEVCLFKNSCSASRRMFPLDDPGNATNSARTLSERLGTSGLDSGCLGVGGLAVRPCAWAQVAHRPSLLGSTILQFYIRSCDKGADNQSSILCFA